MKDLIKEVALEVANGMNPYSDLHKSEFVYFANRFLAELSKRAEAVAWKFKINFVSRTNAACHIDNTLSFMQPDPTRYSDIQPLFTFPPIHDIEAIENRVVEACASVAKERKGYRASENTKNTLDDVIEVIRSGEWRKYK